MTFPISVLLLACTRACQADFQDDTIRYNELKETPYKAEGFLKGFNLYEVRFLDGLFNVRERDVCG